MGAKLTLYSTSACSQCEAAFDLLASMPELAGLAVTVVDVAADARLLAAYGERVPVLRCGGATLDWPFDAAAVRSFIDRCRY